MSSHQYSNDSSILPESFVPSDKDVICGWARQNHHHVGNQRFRDLVEKYAREYVAARTKMEKTQVIATVIDKVREESPKGGFVKKNFDSGRWYELGNEKARDKVGHAIRKAAEDIQKDEVMNSKKAPKRGLAAAAIKNFSQEQAQQQHGLTLSTICQDQGQHLVLSSLISTLNGNRGQDDLFLTNTASSQQNTPMIPNQAASAGLGTEHTDCSTSSNEVMNLLALAALSYESERQRLQVKARQQIALNLLLGTLKNNVPLKPEQDKSFATLLGALDNNSPSSSHMAPSFKEEKTLLQNSQLGALDNNSVSWKPEQDNSLATLLVTLNNNNNNIEVSSKPEQDNSLATLLVTLNNNNYNNEVSSKPEQDNSLATLLGVLNNNSSSSSTKCDLNNSIAAALVAALINDKKRSLSVTPQSNVSPSNLLSELVNFSLSQH